MARLSFRQGIVQHQTDTGGNPTFLQESGGFVNLIVSPDYTIVAFVSGTTDYLYTETQTINNAWGPFTPPQDYWLYWDLDLITGVVTRGSTTFEPVEASAPPPAPGVGQMWFNTVTNTWYEYNGSSFSEVVRVFAAKFDSGTTLQSMSINAPDFRGTQVGLTTPKRVGSLVFDTSGKPLRTGVGNKFFTTENAFVTGVPSSASLRVETITTQGEANAPIAAFHVVEFYAFNKIQVAQPFNQGLRALGILEEDVVTNEVANFVTSGTIYNEAWNFSTANVNDPVYFDAAGEIKLAETIPGQQPIGVIIGPQEILFVPSLFPQVVGAGGGVTDHSLLTNLAADDHTQYHNDTRGDLRYLQLTGGILTGNLIMSAATDVIIPDLPVNPTDAANKQYVDQIAQGLDFKDSAHQCTIADLAGTYDNGTAGLGATLTAITPGVLPPSITDNHADYSGAAGTRNRLLVKSQTDPIENGLYVITDLGSGENVTEVSTIADIADSLDGKYFTFDDGVGSFYVWYDTPGAGVDPAPGGTGIQVVIATGATVAQITDGTIAAINASGALVTAYRDEDDEFYIVDDTIGVRAAAADVDTGFTISTAIAGTASATNWILTRSEDADNSPTSEVSGGMFVFVEDGQTCAGTGWVMVEPVGLAALGTDDLIFTQFSAAQVGPQSRIQDADNNTFVDVELTADSNRIIMNTAGRDVANSGGEIIIAVGPGASGTGYDGAGITIDAGGADILSGAPNFGGSIDLTAGGATPLSNDARGGSINLLVPDASGIEEAGSIELRAGDNTTNVGGDIRLRPGSNAVAGASSAGVRIIGSPTLGATIESSLVFVPKANGDLGQGVGFQAPVAVASELIWTLPATDGSNGQVLTTSGGGILSWQNGGGAGQNLWETIVSDSGNATANTTNDSLSIVGGDGIDTAIVGDVLTITAVPAATGFVLAFGGFGSEGAALSTVYTSDNDITTWTFSRPNHGESFWGPTGARYAPSINTWVNTQNGSAPNAVYSTDDGVTWTAAVQVDGFIGAANTNTGNNLAWSAALGLFIMGGNTGQIQKSSDGIVWSNSTDAPKTTGTFGTSQVTTVTWSPDLALFFCGTTNNEVGFSADGDTWTLTTAEPGGASTRDIDTIYVVGSRIFVSNDIGRIYYSDNNGVTWNQSTLDIAISTSSSPGLAANADGSVIVMGGVGFNDAEYIWRSVDNGVNFTRIDVATQVGIVNMYTFSLIWDTAYGFIMGGRDQVADEQIIVTSTDGLTWTLRLSEQSTDTVPNENNDFKAIASKNQDGQAAAAPTGDPDQNLWETIVSDSGSATADTVTDSLSIVGGAGISTAIVGDVLTITAAGGLPAAVTECNILVANNANTYVERAIPELPRPYDIAMQVFGAVPDDTTVFKFVTPQAFVLLDYGHQGHCTLVNDIVSGIFDIYQGGPNDLSTSFRLFINGVQKGQMGFHDQNFSSPPTPNPAGAVFYSDVGDGWANGNSVYAGSFINVAVGDVIEIKSPVTASTGFEDVAITLRGIVEPAVPCGTITLGIGFDVSLDEQHGGDAMPKFGYRMPLGTDENTQSYGNGNNYAVSDTITLTDGSTVTVDAQSAGGVTEWTVTTLGGAVSETQTLTQTATSGIGTGFEIDIDNPGALEQIPASVTHSEFAVLGIANTFPPTTFGDFIPVADLTGFTSVDLDFNSGPTITFAPGTYFETSFDDYIIGLNDGGSGNDWLVRQTIFGPGGVATNLAWIFAFGA